MVIHHRAAAHYQRKKRKNVDLMRNVVFKDVLHMKSPAGNHPDVWLACAGPHHGHAAGHRCLSSSLEFLFLWTSCLLLMILGVLIATITQNTFHVES